MFDGRYDHNLDDKGRIMVPIRYRELVSDGEWFVIRSQSEKALEVYPKAYGLLLKKKIESIDTAKASSSQKDFIEWMKRIAKESKEISIDNQNRILIPKYMRDWAKIDDVAVIIGSDRGCFEVWNSTVYDEHMNKGFYNLENRDEFMGDFDISLRLDELEGSPGE